jgi:lysophospholipase L1-like esterase
MRMLPWYVPALAGAAAAVVLGGGAVMALSGRVGEPVGLPAVATARATRPAEYTIVALGDSISAGTGDARAGGYPGRLARMLRERGRKTALVNLAVPGAESGDVLQRLDSPNVRAAVARATLIVASAGGNDLSHSLRPETGAPPLEPEVAAARARPNLAALVARLRQLNPDAAIRLVGLYNPFDVDAADAPAARAQLQAWNDLIEEATHADPGALAVPVADLFLDRPDRLAADHYHPGARGHELIAQRVLETLPEGDLRAPAAPADGD